jgi:hypothetical protein
MRHKRVSMILFIVLIIITGIGLASASTKLDVPAISASGTSWTDTGVSLKSGETISIQASGSWTTGVSWTDPEGDASLNGGYTWATWLAPPTANFGELVAFVGDNPMEGSFPVGPNNHYWTIGKGATIVPDRDGKLWLGINDDANGGYLWDNGGSLSVIITPSSTSIPEFPSVIMPVFAILGIMVVFGRKK